MPPAAAAAAITVVAGVALQASLTAIVVSAVLAAGATLLSEQLAPETKKLSPRGLNQTVRSAAEPRQIVYGERRIGGAIVFAHVTRSLIDEDEGTFFDNRFFHLVVAFTGHEVASFETLWLGDERVPLETNPEPSGPLLEVPTAASRFYGDDRTFFLGVGRHLGTADQAADAEMLRIKALYDPDFPGELWGSNHRLRGIAYHYLRFGHSNNTYPGGLPNVTATLRGKKIYDPRSAATVWSDNAALCLRDYLIDDALGLGIPAAEISDAHVIAAANICDEQVALTSRSAAVTADPATDLLTLGEGGAELRLRRGMIVHVSSTGSLPPPLLAATDYYTVPVSDETWRRWGLAANLADARAGNLITITGAGSGDHSLEVISELRYTCNLGFDTSMAYEEVIIGLVTAMAGRLVYSGGLWLMRAGAWTPGSVTLGEDDLRGSLQIDLGLRVQPHIARRDLYNGVKGLYSDRDSDWTEKTYPAVTNSFYESQDNGERRLRTLDLPFTDSPSMAQRIAKIELERGRQQITVEMPCTLAALAVVAAETVLVDNVQLGWSAKAFEIVEWSFAQDASDEGPALGVDLVLRETASGVYDWNAGEETAEDLADDTSLGSPFDIDPPGVPAVSESLYQSRPDILKVRATLSWPRALDSLVDAYEVEWKPSAAAEWQPGGLVPADIMTLDILDLIAGSYDFRVRSLNQATGGVSDWAEAANQVLVGLSAAPVALTDLGLTAMGGLALLRWSQSADLDVRVGGRIEFRHSPSQTATSFAEATSIGPLDGVPGAQIEAVLPLKGGTYFTRPIDSSGNPGAVTSVSTKDATVLAYSSLGQVVEQPSFLGAKTNVVAVDGLLKLEGEDLIDGVADWDADIDDLDGLGGIKTGAVQAGSYDFDGGLDLGSIKRVRVTATIDALVVNIFNLMDDRAEPLDSWESFDETVPHGVADALVYLRHTDDDPAASPTWSTWSRLDAGEFEARAFEFRLDLSNTDSSFNVNISQLEVIAEEVV